MQYNNLGSLVILVAGEAFVLIVAKRIRPTLISLFC